MSLVPAREADSDGDADTVLVAGGTGFTGRAIVRDLVSGPPSADVTRTRTTARAEATARTEVGAQARVRVLARRRPSAGVLPPSVAYTAADLTDRASVEASCEGVTTLVHTVTYVGRDPARCDAVNRVGTRTLLDAARRAGVRRILYISTASVYGDGPHRGAAEGELTPRPRSVASASRLEAEHMVRDAGGVVLRPHLVFGEGDRWVVPTLARLLARVPRWGSAWSHSSMIAVEDLARLVGALVRQDAVDGGEVYHAAHPRPVSMRSLVFALCPLLGLPRPEPGLSVKEHRELCAHSMPELSAHQHELLTSDHWYDSSRVWRRAGVEPGPDVLDRLADYADWYTRHLRGAA
ncbi:NAD-dependent epimerase/dehydratase family protein [Streptomyces beihaiensis]|uniref:NAD(P)-dependent oxidoreductase n=1 Tax=Streptomyces beihaiensis TaxID=2984495 RepID=A0ABT3U4Z8_9ACTN|nr:NAD(P)-dependent oxidoreductase [Streptomyces beihaiensis]MCX3063657.1 NAD(P)-dependent oxidoreductase [Streptomyces beihaiensis]